MMTLRDPSDEMLMAYADGMLEPVEAARIAEQIAARPELARKVEVFRLSATLVRSAVEPLANEPVPVALLAAVKARIAESRQATNVVNFKPRPAKIAARPWLSQVAVAASVAALLGGVAGYSLAPRQTGQEQIAVGLDVPAKVAGVLASLPSGEEATVNGHRVKLVATVMLAEGVLCREFEYAGGAEGGLIAVACRTGAAWRARFAVAAASGDDGYAPASSHEAVEAYMSAVDAGPALSIQEESRLLKTP